MGWGNSQRRRGAAPRRYNLPPPGPGLLIRQASLAYGDSSPAGPDGDTPTPASGDVALTRADRQRYKIPIYNLTTGQPLPDVKGGNLAVNFDNSAFHSLFPEAELAIVRIPRPPDDATPEEAAAHQARMRELVEQGIEIDGQRYDLVLATGARKHGDFLFAHISYWKKIAPTFEKIMAYGGILLTSCREPPRRFKHLRVLIVAEDGEYGSGDCNAKMSDWLFEAFGQQGHRCRAGPASSACWPNGSPPAARTGTIAAWSWWPREPSNAWTTRTWTNGDFGELRLRRAQSSRQAANPTT